MLQIRAKGPQARFVLLHQAGEKVALGGYLVEFVISPSGRSAAQAARRVLDVRLHLALLLFVRVELSRAKAMRRSASAPSSPPSSIRAHACSTAVIAAGSPAM
ncbi:hypothetical protein LYZ93_22160, partial [Xanthomonas hortorum pv. vitians]